MKEICVKTSDSYKIYIGENILPSAGDIIKKTVSICKILIICDDNVFPLYNKALKDSLLKTGYEVREFVIKAGEQSKNFSVAEDIINYLAENNFTRTDIIVALGGGVVGDISGFCAAIYFRGIKFVQIPTTFLAAIDSSVGGKTGINLFAGKNLVGAFHQPAAVITDCKLFSTLSKQVFAQGVAEGIKYGVIKDENLFNDFVNGISNICETVYHCVDIKREIVEKDEFDHADRQLLNFGHTIGHAVEKCSGFKISHGEGVAIGMNIAAKIAYKEGLSDVDLSENIKKACLKFGLPVTCNFNSDELSKAALSDKKRTGEYINLILPIKIGNCIIKKYQKNQLKKLIESGL